MMTDSTLRISVVINRELDPDVFELLTSISSSKTRSELARRLMRDGAAREMKARRSNTAIPKNPDQGKAPKTARTKDPKTAQHRDPQTTTQPPAPSESQVGSARSQQGPGQDLSEVTHPHEADDDFVTKFVTGIQGVPKR